MLVQKQKFVFTIIFLCFAFKSSAEIIAVTDDIGRSVKIGGPARRIVSLAPHITENLFAAGLGDLLIGAVDYSDYPEQAKTIPRVGSYNNINVELIFALQPDLVIGWQEGNQRQQVDQLIALGLKVYISATTKLADIANNIEDFGVLAQKEESARIASESFLRHLGLLISQYSGKKAVSVFYQTWHMPLLTVNDQQFIGQIMTLCSGRNIFGELDNLTPQVSVEAVLARDPHVIITSGMGEARPEWLDRWRQWSALSATKYDNLFFIPPEIIQRHTPRLLLGAEQLCQYLEQIRNTPVEE